MKNYNGTNVYEKMNILFLEKIRKISKNLTLYKIVSFINIYSDAQTMSAQFIR